MNLGTALFLAALGCVSSQTLQDFVPANKPVNNCMEDNFMTANNRNGGGLVCAAKEVTLESLETNRTSCQENGIITLTLKGTVKFNTARYDVGWYIARDGGDALTGSCDIFPLLQGSSPTKIVDKPGSTVAVGSIQWDQDFKDGNDACGDVVMVNGGGGYLEQVVVASNVQFKCVDKNENGSLDFGICFSWRQPGGDDKCITDFLYPGTPSKCFCTRYDIPQVSVVNIKPIVDDC